MKKLLAFFCMFTLLTAFTCENEPLDENIDTTFENTNNSLIGVWNLVEFNSSVSTSTDFNGQVIASEIDLESTTVDYSVAFTESTFSTNGNYSYIVDIMSNGVGIDGEPYTLDNVSGSGNYVTNGNEMTIDGSFFEFEFEGNMDTSALEGVQTVTYQISADGQTLTFIQNETITQNDATTGAVININNNSTSVWSKD